jgi:hypothetical protein
MGGAWQEYERSRETSRAGALFAVAGAAAVVPGEIVELPTLRAEPEPSGVTVAPGQRAYAADGTAYVGIYECTVKGQRVVSDRPCGAGATARVIGVAPATAAAPPVTQYRSTQAPNSSSTARSAAGSTIAVPDNTAACAADDQSIKTLNARMRQRYTSQEGEWLRQEWHRLQQRRYDLRCGR